MAAWCIRRCNVADLPKKIDKQVSDKYKIEKNTISRSVKEDYKDKIEIEIGDSKQEDFKPQVKIMRWDNEVNFSLRAEEHPNATVEITDNVFKYKTPDYEVHQYELDPSDIGEDGGLEFEWVLPHRPLTNTLTATIQTKGLDFFYQPALTPEEIKQGAERPENVVGSYAVYHKEKGGMNRSDGKEYKTGKAFHIYRPKCKDANGNETWGELNIDTNSGILTVTVDNDWLDSAVYPVIVDPTFGYAGVGGSTFTTTNADWAVGGQVDSPTELGTIVSISGYLICTSEHNVGAALYSTDATKNRLNSILAQDTGNELISTTASWITLDLSYEYAISTRYFPVFWHDSAVSYSLYYDASPTETQYVAVFDLNATFESWPAGPINKSSNNSSARASLYLTYTEAGSSTPKTMLLMGIG